VVLHSSIRGKTAPAAFRTLMFDGQRGT